MFEIDPAAHRLTQVTTGARAVRSIEHRGERRRMVYLANDFTHLDDVYAVGARRHSGERKLSNHNAALWSQLTLAPVERMTFKGADGWNVDGFLVKPLGWQAGKKYPLVLSIHGGPAGQYGVDWYPRIPGLRRARLGGVLHQSARVDRLRPQVPARHRD